MPPPISPAPSIKHHYGNPAPNSNLLWLQDHMSTPADAVIFHSGTLKGPKDNNICLFIIGLLCARFFPGCTWNPHHCPTSPFHRCRNRLRGEGEAHLGFQSLVLSTGPQGSTFPPSQLASALHCGSDPHFRPHPAAAVGSFLSLVMPGIWGCTVLCA